MKKVDAVIRPSSLTAVTKALEALDVGGITVSEIASPDDAGVRTAFRGATYAADPAPRLRVEVVTTDVYATPIAWAIVTAARSAGRDDGVVTIADVDDARRIRTGEAGEAAVRPTRTPADVDQRPPVRSTAPGLRAPATSRSAMADFTKVLVTNVVLATGVVSLVFHAPVAYTGLGAGVAGLLIWARERRTHAKRPR